MEDMVASFFYREQPNEYARGTMLSENAVLAQFVHDDDEPILVWANEMRSLGRTDLEWYTRALGQRIVCDTKSA